MENQGMSRIKMIAIITLFLLLLVVGVFIVNHYRKIAHDSVRYANITTIQATLNRIYLDQATYDLGPDCTVGKTMMDPACAQRLSEYIGNPAVLRDPVDTNLLCTIDNCGQRPCQFTVGQDFAQEGYRIYFHLEKGFGGIGPGCHYVTPAGVE